MIDWNNLLCNRSPKLLTEKHFRHQIRIERLRSSERDAPFCVIEIQLLESGFLAKHRRKLVRFLLVYLRFTDYKASLSGSRFSVLLSDTSEAGGERVIERLEAYSQLHDLKIEVEIQTYTVDRWEDHDAEYSSYSPATVAFDSRRRAR